MLKGKLSALIFPLIGCAVAALGAGLESYAGGAWWGDIIHKFFPEAAKLIGGGLAVGMLQLSVKDQHLPEGLHTGTGFIGSKEPEPDENAEGVSEAYPHEPKSNGE